MGTMLCEPTEGGWRCQKLIDGRWVDYDVFASVILKNKEVMLPPLAGKVIFDDENCTQKTEKGLKILSCEA